MASTYLSRTIGSTGNRKICTTSLWFKRTSIDTASNKVLYHVGNGYLVSDYEWAGFSGNQLVILGANSSAVPYYILGTTQVFRDVNAWYHLVYAIDTTQATASDRFKMWINGERVTAFGSETYPSQNFDTQYNLSSNPIKIGDSGNTQYFDGSMAHFHFIDGTAYDASTFGEYDAQNVWKPKTAPSVTYGTNGFFLKFANAGSLGTDSSGNGNDFTVNGTGTQTLDTPSNVFATWNPLYKKNGTEAYSQGNLTMTGDGPTRFYSASTLGVSAGKWYCEIKQTANDVSAELDFGISYDASLDNYNNYEAGRGANSWGYKQNGFLINNNSTSSFGNTWTTNDIIGIGLDLDNNKLYFSKNGTWQNSADPAAGTGGISITASSSTTTGFYNIVCGDDSTSFGGGNTFSANFGNGYFGTTAVSTPNADGDGYGKFEYSVPTGYYALCTKNIQTYG